MAIDPSRNSAFKAVAAKVEQALIGQGYTVVPQVVTDALLATIDNVAGQLGVSLTAAMRHIEPQALASGIVEASTTQGLHGLRPVRYGRTVEFPGWTSGLLIAALGQAAKYAISNKDDQTADHAADLISEIGLALCGSDGAETIITDQGLWSETGDILERAADRIAAGEWTHCRCGVDHGTAALDAAMPARLRKDAAFARKIADSGSGPPPLRPVHTAQHGDPPRTRPPA